MVTLKEKTLYLANILQDLGVSSFVSNSSRNYLEEKKEDASVYKELTANYDRHNEDSINKVSGGSAAWAQISEYSDEKMESNFLNNQYNANKANNTINNIKNQRIEENKETPAKAVEKLRKSLTPTSEIVKKIESKLQNINKLSEIKKNLLEFEDCPLSKTATNTVFGTGNEEADVLMIGEAPGAEEDLQGEPFVGRSGKLLTKALESIGIFRENIFITNSIFWRPPGNRNPTEAEVLMCKPFVNSIIRIVNPKIILAIGKIAANFLLEEDVAIGKMRGKWYGSGNLQLSNKCLANAKVRVLYHPAYLLRNPRQKKVFWFDLLEVKDHIIQEKLTI